jgi:hypothetical protein
VVCVTYGGLVGSDREDRREFCVRTGRTACNGKGAVGERVNDVCVCGCVCVLRGVSWWCV